jgi:hypothetical protein
MSLYPSAVLPIVHLINNKFLKEADDDTKLTADLKESIKNDLNLHYSQDKLGEELIILLQMAMFLDPRFKTKYIDAVEKVNLEKIEEEVSSMSVEIRAAHPLNSTDESDSVPPPQKKRKTLGSSFKDNDQNEEEQAPVISIEQRVRKELESYSISPKLDFEEDPLQWWRMHNIEYPCLSRLAKKYLCVCATSCPSERLFSTSGNIVTPSKCSMKPDTVDMLTFLANNL